MVDPCGSCHESVYETWCRHCVPSPDRERWPWPVLNPIQTQALHLLQENPKANLIVSTGTGTGKTACAEFALSALQPPEKALVMEPLKALAREKVQDWGKRFPHLKFVELTSDADLGAGKKRNEHLKAVDVIVCSYEMLDSMTRKPKTYTVLQDLTLLVIDEVHELGDESRGGGLDGALTRFLMRHKPQVIALSATFDNIDDLKRYLEQFVTPVEVVALPFVPIEVTITPGVVAYPRRGRESCMVAETLRMMGEVDGGILVMALSIPAVMRITELLNRERGKGTAVAHYSELSRETRHATEDLYRSRGARVIVSTPTLLAGVNIPCQGIVLDVSYFDQDEHRTRILPVTKIRQASGRVGRLPWYKTGHVTYVSEVGVADEARRELAKPMVVKGTLFFAADEVLNTEIQMLTVTTRRTLLEWYNRTYSRFSNQFSSDGVAAVFARELDWLTEHTFAQLEDRATGRVRGQYKGLVAHQHHVRPRFLADAEHVVSTTELMTADDGRAASEQVFGLIQALAASRYCPIKWSDRKEGSARRIMGYARMLEGETIDWGMRSQNYQWVQDAADTLGRLSGAMKRLGAERQRGFLALDVATACFAKGCVPPKLARLAKLLTASGVKQLGYKRLLMLYANGVTAEAIVEGHPPRALGLPRRCKVTNLFDATPDDFYDFTPEFGPIMPDKMAEAVLRAIGRQS